MTSSDNESMPKWRQWIEQNAFAVGTTGLAALAVALVLVVVALAGGEELEPEAGGPDTTEVTTTSPTDQAPPPSEGESPDTTNPPAPAGDELIAVKIDNAEAARPQIGLNAAQLVFEVPVEGGLTRFLGVFSPDDVLVGPVRSLRPVDVDLIPALAGTVVSTGGQPFVVGPLRSNGIDVVDYDTAASPLQSLERPQPHHLFVNLSQIDATPSPRNLPTGELGTASGDATAVTIPYATEVSWVFEDGKYARSDAGAATMVLDALDTEPVPLTTDTVVVLAVASRSAGYTDSNGADVPDFDVIGSGRMYVFNDGRVFEGTWSRASLADDYVFTGTDGSDFSLPSGRIFVHLLDRDLSPEY